MSWSAIACYEDVNTFKPSENMLFPVLGDHPVVAELKERFDDVHETIGGGVAIHGATLGLSFCGRLLERATGRSPYGTEWFAHEVQSAVQAADWLFDVPEEDRGVKECVKVYLEACAAHKLGIMFA